MELYFNFLNPTLITIKFISQTMEQQEQTQRDWIYLLPGGKSAENMKAGRMILSEQSGHNFSSESFRSLFIKNVK